MESTKLIEFWVPGRPAVQGNHRVSRQGRIYEQQSKSLKVWREAIGLECSRLHSFGASPVKVELHFFLRRPLCHFVAGRRDRPLLPDAPQHHASKRDIDKLTRPVLDALSGLLFDDDGQVVALKACKTWTDTDEFGCLIRVTGV